MFSPFLKSLKHHPDKRGGDAETFRVLNRAQKVLMNPKLRQQYDILGLDLDDDEDENNNNLHSRGDDNGDKDSDETTAQGIVHEIASMVMASIMHLGVRTGAFAVVGLRRCLLTFFYNFLIFHFAFRNQ